MISLNAAMATDGVVVGVADGAALAQPIQIIHVATASSASAFTRSQVEDRQGRARHAGREFRRGRGAQGLSGQRRGDPVGRRRRRVDACAADGRRADAANITSAIFDGRRESEVQSVQHDQRRRASAAIQGFITLAGEGTELNVNGVNLLKGTQHGDTTLVVDHAVPHCTSREVFRAVIDDRAHSVFQGRIIVRPDAQKTDGKMMTRALLLSDEAEADNKPELEIFADDVTCGHGATAGALDESLLFYLRARGLPEKEAQALLIQAFVGEAIEGIADDDLREAVMAAAERWLEARA